MLTAVSGANCELYWKMATFIESVCEKALTDTAFNPYSFGQCQLYSGTRFNAHKVLL